VAPLVVVVLEVLLHAAATSVTAAAAITAGRANRSILIPAISS
jgi:hypothetical protein